MDISGYDSSYAALSAQNAVFASEDSSAKKAVSSSSTDEQLYEACKEFEAYFVEQVFKEAQKTVGETESDSGADNTLRGFYKDQLAEKLSSAAVNQESLGLAQQLYEQLKRNVSEDIL